MKKNGLSLDMYQVLIFIILINFTFSTREKDFVIKIYYEPLSVNSMNFFNYSFKKFYQNKKDFIESGLIKKIILQPGALTKYEGDSGLTGKNGLKDIHLYNFSCKHGKNECLANKFHTCAMYFLDLEKYNEYVLCYMKNISTRVFRYNNYKVTQHCAEKLKFCYENIENCVNKYGAELLYNTIRRRDFLPQKVEHDPWILINNQFDNYVEKNMKRNMIEYMCKFFEYNKSLVSCLKYKNAEIN